MATKWLPRCKFCKMGGKLGVHKPSAWAVAIALVSVSVAAPLFRLATVGPIAASAYRLLIAVVLLLPFAMKYRAEWAEWDRRTWALVGLSGVALAAHFGLWVSSLFYTTIAASVSLVTLQGILTAIGAAWLLRERMHWSAWVGVAVATAGAWTIAGTNFGDSHTFGNLLALGGGVGSAAYVLIGRKLRSRVSTLAYAVPVYLLAGVLLWFCAYYMRKPMLGGGAAEFVVLLLLAAVPMLGGHTLINYAMAKIRPATVMTWILLEPVGASLLAWWWFSEVPALTIVLGGALVLAGGFLVVRPQPAQEIPATPS